MGLPLFHFSSSFPTNSATCPPHLIFLDLIIIMILGESVKFEDPNYVIVSVLFFPLDPDIFFIALFSTPSAYEHVLLISSTVSYIKNI
jgi:hypothetical protein